MFAIVLIYIDTMLIEMREAFSKGKSKMIGSTFEGNELDTISRYAAMAAKTIQIKLCHLCVGFQHSSSRLFQR